jgi:hypothetical protein
MKLPAKVIDQSARRPLPIINERSNQIAAIEHGRLIRVIAKYITHFLCVLLIP